MCYGERKGRKPTIWLSILSRHVSKRRLISRQREERNLACGLISITERNTTKRGIKENCGFVTNASYHRNKFHRLKTLEAKGLGDKPASQRPEETLKL